MTYKIRATDQCLLNPKKDWQQQVSKQLRACPRLHSVYWTPRLIRRQMYLDIGQCQLLGGLSYCYRGVISNTKICQIEMEEEKEVGKIPLALLVDQLVIHNNKILFYSANWKTCRTINYAISCQPFHATYYFENLSLFLGVTQIWG